MEESAIVQYFEGKTIFVIGATVCVEKIIRLQPNVKKVFLLIKSTTKRSVKERLEEVIISSELFQNLRARYGKDFNHVMSSKLLPISGDIAQENLGISDSQLREEMCREINIIVNSATTTNFYERYDVAYGVNVLGTMTVCNFSTKCPKLEVLLHVSTAFVHVMREGLLQETSFHMGETLLGSKHPHLDIKTEKCIIAEKLKTLEMSNENETIRVMKDLGIVRSTMHGWPNTYVFTKAMGEMVLGTFKDRSNVVIIRPTIITSTYKDPFPGWIEGVRTLDSIFVAYGKGKLNFFVGDPESTLDMIPADMVVNCMLTVIASHSYNQWHDLFVYHIGSSRRNPITYAEIKWLMHRYLSENPLLDEMGRHIKIGKPTTLNTMSSFRYYIALHYLPFIKLLKVMNLMLCNRFKNQYTNAKRRLDNALRLADLYKPHLFFQGIFDDTNTEKLRIAVRGHAINNMVDALNFDPTCIQWDQYFLGTHFPGVVKYALK